MYVEENPIYPGKRGFWLVRTNGTSTDFSFKECLSPSSNKKKTLSAFRSAIEPYTFQFKQRFSVTPQQGIRREGFPQEGKCD